MNDESKSEEILQKIIAVRKDRMIIPTSNCFLIPTEGCDQEQKWEIGLELPSSKFYCQVLYAKWFNGRWPLMFQKSIVFTLCREAVGLR